MGGKVLVGNMGFHSRMKYGVLGENANIPGRLEELNKHYSTQMLISQTTYLRLEPDAFVIRPIDFIYLRYYQSAASEIVYQVMAKDRKIPGKPHRLKAVAELHSNAFERYRSRDFEGAATLFGQVNETMKAITKVEED